MTAAELDQARRLLCRLQDALRTALRSERRGAGGRLRRIATVTAADIIYGLDQVSERTVLAWLAAHWPRRWPVEVVMEGREGAGPVTVPAGTPVAATRFKLIIDPVDGTRGLMFDKRSAWSLAALAPQRGPATSLRDLVVAAMTELPVAKAGWGDQLSAVRGRGARAERIDLRTGRRTRLRPRPAAARAVGHGFGSFVKFFPAAKAWLAAREEALWRELGEGGEIFDDQYISTGGQLAELCLGRDRFVADLRPLAFAALGLDGRLSCHPYDLCTALVAAELGCVITGPDGRPPRAPLDTTTPVAWVGYANRALARRIGPVLRRVLAEG